MSGRGARVERRERAGRLRRGQVPVEPRGNGGRGAGHNLGVRRATHAKRRAGGLDIARRLGLAEQRRTPTKGGRARLHCRYNQYGQVSAVSSE